MPALVVILLITVCVYPASGAWAQSDEAYTAQLSAYCEGECPIDLIRSHDDEPLLIYPDRIVRLTDSGVLSLSLRRSIQGFGYRSDGVPVWIGSDSLGVIDANGDMTSLVKLPIRPSGLSISSNDVLYVYESGPVSTVVRLSQGMDSLNTITVPFRVNSLAHLNERILLASKNRVWTLDPDGLRVYFANDELRRVNTVSVVDRETVLIATDQGLLLVDAGGKEAEWLSRQPASKAITTRSAIYVLDATRGQMKALPLVSE